MRARTDVAEEVASLNDLGREDFIERWRKIYDVSPPKGVRQELMVRAATWHLQAKHLGGYSAETRRSAISKVESEILSRGGRSAIAAGEKIKLVQTPNEPVADLGKREAAFKIPRERRRLTPGARLMREWGGRTHIVNVIEGGYVFEAKVYASLTAIAGKSLACTGRARGSSDYERTQPGHTQCRKRSEQLIRLIPIRRPIISASTSLCDLCPQIDRGGARSGVQLARCPARGMRRVYHLAGRAGLEATFWTAMTMAAYQAERWSDRRCSDFFGTSRKDVSMWSSSTRSIVSPARSPTSPRSSRCLMAIPSPSSPSPSSSTRPPRWGG